MAEHSPLPWTVKGRMTHIEIRAEHQDDPVVADTWDEANAALIVQAVNSHQALVEALRAALELEASAEQAGAADAVNLPSKLAHARVDAITARIRAALALAQVKP